MAAIRMDRPAPKVFAARVIHRGLSLSPSQASPFQSGKLLSPSFSVFVTGRGGPTLHEQPNNGVGPPPVVDEAQVVARVAGRDGVDAEAEDAQRDRDPVREAVGDGHGAVVALVGLFEQV